MSVVKITVDTSQAESELDELEVKSNTINRAIAQNIRRSTSMIFFGLEAAGVVIDQSLRMAAESFALIAEIATQAATLTGWGILIRGAQIALLWASIYALYKQRDDVARQTAALEGLINVASMYT